MDAYHIFDCGSLIDLSELLASSTFKGYLFNFVRGCLPTGGTTLAWELGWISPKSTDFIALLRLSNLQQRHRKRLSYTT
jgi:hypothetical protein